MPDAPLAGCCNCTYFECGTMSDKFKSLDANEKAALESALYRCRALVDRLFTGRHLQRRACRSGVVNATDN